MEILDGGVGRELARRGAPFRQPEWSALALWEAPQEVKAVHIDFIHAGADIITTNNYAVVPFHIGEERFALESKTLVQIALEQAQAAVAETATQTRIAGCIPPLFGSYRADLFQADHVEALITPIIQTLSTGVDFWLAETQSCLKEVELVHQFIPKDGREYWVSFTLQDEIQLEEATLRSGENLTQAAALLQKIDANAVLFNCCQPEVILKAIIQIRALLPDIKIGAYANAFPPQNESATANDGLDEVRADLSPDIYLSFAKQWQEAGASIIGGCCGISPQHIAKLSTTLKAESL